MRILLSAYACRPHQGSEHGLGWGWATSLAELGHCVHVVTRAGNRLAIERELSLNPVRGLSFTWVGLPAGLRELLAGAGGRRVYYALWQMAAYAAARRLVVHGKFDLVHHVTYAKYWSLCPMAFLPLPFLWGPVGGGESAPMAHWAQLGLGGAVFEIARAAARRTSEFNPLLRLAARRAALSVATTPETAQRLRRLGARRVVAVTQVALSNADLDWLGEAERPPPPPWRVAMVGNLLPLKAPHLVVGALGRLKHLQWHLDVIGDGPWRQHMENLAVRLDIRDRLTFHGNLPRPLALKTMSRCHLLAFAGLHDSGGMVCAEAMAAGLPVVALALGGPNVVVGDEGGVLVDASSPAVATAGLAEALERLMASPDALPALSARAKRRARQAFPWLDRARTLYDLLPEGRP